MAKPKKSKTELIVCKHCEYVAYDNESLKECPKCSSPIERVDKSFKNEFIIVPARDTYNKKVNIKVTFKQMGEQVESIIGKDLKKVVIGPPRYERIIFMIKVYLWTLLNKSPKLWLDIDTVANGLKELMTLKLKNEVK